MRKDIKPGVKVRHFKGNVYNIIAIAMHTETGENLVIYASEDGKDVYARPYAMFNSEVEKDKYPEVEQKYRFEVISEV